MINNFILKAQQGVFARLMNLTSFLLPFFSPSLGGQYLFINEVGTYSLVENSNLLTSRRVSFIEIFLKKIG